MNAHLVVKKLFDTLTNYANSNQKNQSIIEVKKLSLKLLWGILVVGLVIGYSSYNKPYRKEMVAGYSAIKTVSQTQEASKINKLNNILETNDTGTAVNIHESVAANSPENSYMLRIGQEIDINPQIGTADLETYVEQFANNFDRVPVNASLSISNGVLQVSRSQKGRVLDRDKLKNDLMRLINSGKTHGKIVMAASDLKPEITEADTIHAQSQARIYLRSAPINVTFEDSTWTADRTEIGRWISFSENNGELVAQVDTSGFVDRIGEQVKIPAQDREIQEGTGEILKEGQDGRKADTDTLNTQVKDALSHGRPNRTFALVTSIIPAGQIIINLNAQPGRYTGHYIDVNLSEQTLYAFDGPNLANQFLVSTGKRGYETPTGEFNIWGKTRSQLMDGPDYYLPNVPWISWVVGENAIHGTYWHSNFGTPMSHGCINASIPDAEWVYNFVEVGTPVYIHY